MQKRNYLKALEKKYPKMVLVTSTGAAAEYKGYCMGVFLLAGEHNNRPYYRQKHTLDTQGALFLYSHDNGIWYVSDTLGKAGGSLKNTTKTASVPTSGWQYIGGRWHHDLALTVTPLSDLSSATCSSITISAKGEAARKQAQCMGTFTPTGDYSAGRQVFSSDRGRYLMVPAYSDRWGVLDSVTATAADIRSGCSPGMCPAHPRARHSHRESQKSWQYSDNGWREADIIVTCATHNYQ